MNEIKKHFIYGRAAIPVAVYHDQLCSLASVNDRIKGPLEILERKDFLEYIENQIFSCLNDLEVTCIKKRFGFDNDPMKLDEIGEDIGFTDEYVRQIIKRSLTKLKKLKG